MKQEKACGFLLFSSRRHCLLVTYLISLTVYIEKKKTFCWIIDKSNERYSQCLSITQCSCWSSSPLCQTRSFFSKDTWLYPVREFVPVHKWFAEIKYTKSMKKKKKMSVIVSGLVCYNTRTLEMFNFQSTAALVPFIGQKTLVISSLLCCHLPSSPSLINSLYFFLLFPYCSTYCLVCVCACAWECKVCYLPCGMVAACDSALRVWFPLSSISICFHQFFALYLSSHLSFYSFVIHPSSWLLDHNFTKTLVN